MSRGVFRRPHFAPRRRVLLPSAAPASLPRPLRVNPMRRLLAGALFRRPYFAPYYRRRVVLPSAPAVPLAVGELVAAITTRPALDGSTRTRAALDGRISTTPALKAEVTA